MTIDQAWAEYREAVQSKVIYPAARIFTWADLEAAFMAGRLPWISDLTLCRIIPTRL
jgi:hypothetical protein